MKLTDIPYWNRPSNRIRNKELNPAELLSIIIWSGKKGENAIDMSNRLLAKYSLAKLSRLSLSHLEREVGRIGAARIKAMYELFALTHWVSRGGFKPVIESAQDVYNHFVDKLKDSTKSQFALISVRFCGAKISH